MGNTCRCCKVKVIEKETEQHVPNRGVVKNDSRHKPDKIPSDDELSCENTASKNANCLSDADKKKQCSANEHVCVNDGLGVHNVQVVVNTNQTTDELEYMDVYDMGTQMTVDVQCSYTESDSDNSENLSSASAELNEHGDWLNANKNVGEDLQMKFVTKGLRIPVYVQTKDKEHLSQDNALQQYCKKYDEMSKWLNKNENAVKQICELPIPLEPNALQEQIKLVEELVATVSCGKPMLDEFSSALDKLLSCPGHVYEHLIVGGNGLQTVKGDFQHRYALLLEKAESLCAKLHSTLEQAECVRNQFEFLQKTLQDLCKQTSENKKTSSASNQNVQQHITEMERLNENMNEVNGAMEALQNQCVQLFGSGTSEAGCSLKNTLANLVTLHGNTKHEVEHWYNHLNDIQSKLRPFETAQKELVEFLDETNQKIQHIIEEKHGDNLDLKKVEKMIADLNQNCKDLEISYATLSGKEQEYIQTIACGESLVISCCFDSSPVGQKVDCLKEKWKQASQSYHDGEMNLSQNSKQLNKSHSALLKVQDWIVSSQKYIADKNQTVNLEALESNLHELENILEEGKSIETDLNCKHFLKTFFKLQAHELPDMSFEMCLKDVNDVKTNESAILSEVAELYKKFDSFDSLLDPLEAELEEWKSDLDNLILEELSSKCEQLKLWKGKVIKNDQEFVKLQHRMENFQQHSQKDGFQTTKDKFGTLATRWAALLETCDELYQTLLNKCKAHQEYCEKHHRFVEWLQDKRTIYSMLDVSCTDVSGFNKQNAQLQSLRVDVESHETQLKDIGTLVEVLPALNDLHQVIAKDWEKLRQDLMSLCAKQSESATEIQTLFELLNELRSWSKSVCEELAGTKLLCNVGWLEDEQKKITDMQNSDFEKYKKIFEELLDSANKLLEHNYIAKSLYTELTTKVNDAFNNAKQALDKHNTLILSTKSNIEMINESCKNTAEAMKKLSVELSSLEDQAYLDITDVDVSLQELQCHLDGVGSKITQHKETECLYKEVLKCCHCDAFTTAVEDVHRNLAETQKRINKIKENLLHRKLEVIKFNDLSSASEIRLNEIEVKINLTKEMSGLTTKQMKFSKEIHNDLFDEASSVLALCDFAKQLSAKTHDDAHQSIPHISACEGPLIERANKIAEKFQDLKLNVAELQSDLEHILKFENEISEAAAKLRNLEAVVDDLEPISREQKHLSTQRESTIVVLHSGRNLKDIILDLEKRYLSYSESAFGMSNHERDIKSLVRNVNRLVASCSLREKDIGDKILKLEEFTSDAETVEISLTSMIKEMQCKEIKTGNLGTLVEMQTDLKKFRKAQIYPVREKMQNANTLGFELIYTAHQSVRIQHISDKLKAIERLWNELNQQVAKHDSNIQKALIKCGQLRDVLESYDVWLKNVELMISQQHLPPWEYSVIAVQLEEHKIMQDMVQKEHEVLVLLIDQYSDFDSNVAEEDQIKLNALKAKWNDLWERIDKRSEQLAEIMSEARLFNGLAKRFEKWLTKVEKQSMDVVFTGNLHDRIEKEIIHQQAIMRDLKHHETEMHEIKSTHLKDMLEDDINRESLESFIDQLRSKYNEVAKYVAGRCDILEENKKLSHLFNDRLLNLFAFVAECKMKLSKWEDDESNIHVLDAKPVFMEKAIHACQEILQDVTNKNSMLDAAIKQGRELLSKCAGDDNQAAHEKLDSLSVEFNLLMVRANRIVDKLSNMQTVSTELESAHQELSAWFKSSNKLFVAMESTHGMSLMDREQALQEFQPTLHEPTLKVVEVNAGKLTSISMWWGTQLLSKLHGFCQTQYRMFNERYSSHCKTLEALKADYWKFDEHLSACYLLLERLNTLIEDLETVHSFDKENLCSKRDIEKEMQTVVAEIGEKSVKLEQESHKLIYKLEPTDAHEVLEKINDYRTKLKETMDRHAFYTKHVGLAISLACKWHESSDDLTDWLNSAHGTFNLIQAEKFAQMGTYRQKVQTLLNKHLDMKPQVENIVKCSKDIQKILGNNNAVNNIVARSEAKKKEYDVFTDKLKRCVSNADNICNSMDKVVQEMEKTFQAVRSVVNELHKLPPVSLDMESIRDRKNIVEALGAEKCMKMVHAVDNEFENLRTLLISIGYDHLSEGIMVKLGALQDLKRELENLVAHELSQLDLEMQSLSQFSKCLATTNSRASGLQDTVGSVVVHKGVSPETMSQQTVQLETLTEELLAVIDLHNKLQTIADECKNVTLISGHEASFITRELQEVAVNVKNLQALFEKLKMEFNEAMEYAIYFYKTSTELKQFFTKQCDRIDHFLVSTNDIDLIKKQIEMLKTIRSESKPNQIEAKKLCSRAFELMAESDVDTISQQQDVVQLQNASNLLDEKLLQTQVALDQALMDVGELQHAIDEMVKWAEVVLSDLTKQNERVGRSANDSKKLALEQAKLKVTAQDVAAHESSFTSIVSKFDKALNTSLDSSDTMSQDVEKLETFWNNIQELLEEIRLKLEKGLQLAQMKEAELVEIDFWVDEQLANLSAANFFGGLPETAQQQLDLHNVFLLELRKKKQALHKLVTDHDMDAGDVTEKMNKLSSQADARGEKLQEALHEAKAFHENLQNFTSWLGQAEKTLEAFQETNYTWLLPDLTSVFNKQKNFEEEVTGKRSDIFALDKAGSHLKYFSQKQDGILIKNLLLSVHSRWDKLVSDTSSRSISIADIHKKSKQFHDDYEKLMDWINQAKQKLGESDSDSYVDAPELLKTELENYKEFQRALSEKRPVYDGVNRSGGVLTERVTLHSDKQSLEAKLKQLKREWNSLNETSVQRKHQLEESLLFSGRFIDAIDSLLQWLCKIEPEVNSQTPLKGDIHTVNALLDRHNILHNEFNARHANVESLQQSVNRGQGDSWVTHQLQELLERWNDVSDKITHKQECLEDALCSAKKLHSTAQQVLEDLSSVEKYLQLQQKFPDDEFQLEELKASYHTLTQELKHKEVDKNNVLSLATSILNDVHPDALTPVRQLMTVVQAKWDEVKAKNQEYGVNLNNAIDKLKQDTEKMKNLESWLTKAEEDLSAKENLQVTAENIEKLIDNHDVFHKDMLAHQPDYEMLMNLYGKRKAAQTKRKDVKKSPREQDETPMESMFSNTHTLWQKVWLKALEYERKLQEAKENIRRSDQQQEFDFDEWRKRYMKWMKHKRARVMDFFRELDKDGSGQITRQQFIQEILKSKFQTDEAEMAKVADVFDKDGDGYIDYYEFIAALYPARDTYKPETDADKIDDEVIRQVAKCTCCKKFKVEQIAENKYKFGDNQQLRLVRILRSTVMVRVGGGWMALDEFLIKNDPCRAKGRTNTELREKFILPSGASQAMTPFRTKRTPVKSPQKQARASPTSSIGESSGSASKHTSPAKSASSLDRSLHETPKRASKIPTKERTPKR